MRREPWGSQQDDDARLRRVYGALALVLFGFIAFGIVYHLD